MLKSQQAKPGILLIALPLLAAALFLFREQSRQSAPALAKSAKPSFSSSPAPVSPAAASTNLAASFYPSFHWSPTAAQKLILNQRWKKSKTLPASIIVAGSALPAANAVYTLANGYDVNGFQYYQTHDKTHLCQWSTLNCCWSIRGSLVVDSPGVEPSAEFFSAEKQTYTTGPTGRYGYGGLAPTIRGSRPPIVKLVGTVSH